VEFNSAIDSVRYPGRARPAGPAGICECAERCGQRTLRPRDRHQRGADGWRHYHTVSRPTLAWSEQRPRVLPAPAVPVRRTWKASCPTSTSSGSCATPLDGA